MTFIQFMRPNGRQVPVTIERPDDIEALAQKLVQAGCRLEIEMLTTDQISMAVERGGDDDLPIAMEICHNGPTEGAVMGVPECVDKMIADAVRLLKL